MCVYNKSWGCNYPSISPSSPGHSHSDSPRSLTLRTQPLLLLSSLACISMDGAKDERTLGGKGSPPFSLHPPLILTGPQGEHSGAESEMGKGPSLRIADRRTMRAPALLTSKMHLQVLLWCNMPLFGELLPSIKECNRTKKQ